jgi:uncharacterized protein YxjI
VSASETIEAIATASGYTNSPVATAVYTISKQAAAPTFSPGQGTYNSTQTVTISDTTPSPAIYYTTNGTTPTTSSTKYTGPITVSASETIEAIATASGYTNSPVATAVYTISLAGTLSITSTAFNPSTATVGTGYQAQQAMAATGGTGSYTWSISGQPSGMSMNATSGALYGTPTASGTFNITVTVKDSSSPQKTASKVLTLTVSASAPVVTGVSPSPVPGLSGTQTLSINGSNFVSGATLTYHDPQGNSYPGHATTFVSSSQLIDPAFNNTNDGGTWTVTVVNPGSSSSTAFSFTVSAVATLSITSTAFNPSTATVGTGYQAQQAMAATGGTGSYTWSISGQPSGMSMNATSGALYGTPTASGTFNITVTVKDSSSPQKTASKVLTLTVSASAAPTITSIYPTSMQGMNSQQSLTIYGSNFQTGDYLTMIDPLGDNFTSVTSRLTVYPSQGQIVYLINNGNTKGTWRISVNSPDGSQHSNVAYLSVY